MADITYTRGYSHSDWIDNQDVVQAGGERGFNQEFHSLEAELDKIKAAAKSGAKMQDSGAALAKYSKK